MWSSVFTSTHMLITFSFSLNFLVVGKTKYKVKINYEWIPILEWVCMCVCLRILNLSQLKYAFDEIAQEVTRTQTMNIHAGQRISDRYILWATKWMNWRDRSSAFMYIIIQMQRMYFMLTKERDLSHTKLN